MIADSRSLAKNILEHQKIASNAFENLLRQPLSYLKGKHGLKTIFSSTERMTIGKGGRGR